MGKLYNFTAIGLTYDVVGVAILGFAFFSTPISAIFLNSRHFHGGNNGVLNAGIEIKTDGITGTAILFIGFVFQFLGAAACSSEIISQLFLLFLLIFLISYFVFLRKSIFKYFERRAKAFEEKWRKNE